jgi:hypothetical protein
MKKSELIKKLQDIEEDFDIWISDSESEWVCTHIKYIEVLPAYDVVLYRDDIYDEYEYTEDMEDSQIKLLLENGYVFTEDEEILYKNIILITFE